MVLSRLMLVLGAAPVLAPTVGGELLRLTDWRGIFAALAMALVMLGGSVGAFAVLVAVVRPWRLDASV